MDINELIAENKISQEANTSNFQLKINSYKEIKMKVLNFDLLNASLSQDYKLVITVKTSDIKDIESLLSQSVQFSITRNRSLLYVNGYITNVNYSIGGRDEGIYLFEIHSFLHELTKRIGNFVYLNKDVVEIVTDIFQRSNVQENQLVFNLNESYLKNEITIQHAESDYDFLVRLLSLHGIFFMFSHRENNSKIEFYDTNPNFQKLEATGELAFKNEMGAPHQNETLFSISQLVELLPSDVILKNYNYRTPEVSILSKLQTNQSIQASGEVYNYGWNLKSVEESDNTAKILSEVIEWKRNVFIAESDCRGLYPGCRFLLQEHTDSSFNIEYFVISIEHTGSQNTKFGSGGTNNELTYCNKMLLIPLGVQFRSEIIPKPQVLGVITANIESTGGEYAHLDEQGRYKVKLKSDLSTTNDASGSHLVRLMQSYSGRNYGIHFPLHSGTEVVISCVNGDPDRPILLGVLPNPDTSSPVTSSNKSENIIRTWGGNELRMNDLTDGEEILLSTRDENNFLRLDASKSGHKISLSSKNGKLAVLAAKSILIESGGSQDVQAGKNHVVLVENRQQLMTKNKQIEMIAATDILLNANKNIKLQSEKENIEVRAGKNLILDVDNDMSVEVNSKNLTLQVTNGNLDVTAAKNITVKGQGGGSIHIGQAGASIDISSSGDLTVNAKSVNINGESINITANSISNN